MTADNIGLAWNVLRESMRAF